MRKPHWHFGLYVPHGTRWPVGVRVARGHLSAGVRGLFGFYAERCKD
jgi:hypothetical protein